MAKSIQVKQMLDCHNAYFSSLETAVKTFYTHTFKRKYEYTHFIETHRDLLGKIYEVAKMLIQKKESSLEVYEPGFEKELKMLREWTVNGMKKHKEVFRKAIK